MQDLIILLSSLGVFKTTEGSMQATYTPKNLGVLAGLLREANLVGGKANAKDIYTTVFDAIYNKTILREAEASGETGGDSDGDGIPYIVGGTKPFVFAAEATYDLSTAAIANNSLDTLGIYPNPATDFININDNTNELSSYTIHNLLGQTVLQGIINNKQIDVSTLEKGVYLIKFKTNSNSLTKKFFKK